MLWQKYGFANKWCWRLQEVKRNDVLSLFVWAVRRTLAALPTAHTGPPVVTGMRWYCRWRPGGSTLVDRLTAGCRWPPSCGPRRKESFWSCCLCPHGSPNWTRSSQQGLVGAFGNSPWLEKESVNEVVFLLCVFNYSKVRVEVCS